MAIKIGVIAEDESDVEVIRILIAKLQTKKFSIDSFVGKGCGKLKTKAPSWSKALHTKGCDKLLLVHDLDRNNEKELRTQLEEILKDAPQIRKSVIIPIEELEGWLLSDENAIKKALKLKKNLAVIHHPENRSSPKEYIAQIVSKASNKVIRYVNTVHNPLIAIETDILLIQKKCPSFSVMTDFFAKK